MGYGPAMPIAHSSMQVIWRAGRDLNAGPSAPQADALSAELPARISWCLSRLDPGRVRSPSYLRLSDSARELWYARRDLNAGLRLRRPTLYP